MSAEDIMISVAIPSYNSEKFIIKLLDSIKNQTYKNFEIVISDDCSTDNTFKLICEYKEKHSNLNINLIEQKKNIGLIANRNVILKECKGKYITFVDSDDYIEEKCLELLIEEANRLDADWVIGAFRTVNNKGKVLQNQYLPPNPSKYMCGCHHGCIYKKKIFEDNNIKFIDCGSIEDCYLTAVFATYAKSVGFVNEILYNWVIHDKSTSASSKEINDFNNVRIFEKFLNNISKYYQKMEDESERIIFEYQIIKIYCVMLYHNYRYAKIKEKLKAYNKMKELMLNFNSKYLENPLIKWKYPTPIRKYAKRIIWLTIMLEKMHLMPLALLIYHIITKVYYFNL